MQKYRIEKEGEKEKKNGEKKNSTGDY